MKIVMLVAALVGLSSCHSEGIGAQTRARIREQERAEALAPPAQQVSFEPQVVVGTRPPASADEVVEGTVVRARQHQLTVRDAEGVAVKLQLPDSAAVFNQGGTVEPKTRRWLLSDGQEVRAFYRLEKNDRVVERLEITREEIDPAFR